MKFLPLVIAGLWRKPLRTIFTMLAIVVAFLLFGVMHGVIAGFDTAVAQMSETRLRVMNRANILEALPISYEARIARIPGVEAVCHIAIMLATYKEPTNGFTAAAVSDQCFRVFSEMSMPADQSEAFRTNRLGAVTSPQLAERFGWKVGDRITLTSSMWPREDGTMDWPLDLVGLFSAGPDDERSFNEVYFNYEYLDEARAIGKGTVHQFGVLIDDRKNADRIAQAIDREFANSSFETQTLNDRDYLSQQLKQIGNVQFFVNAILGAVLFTLLFLTGNTMMQSVRDRIPELGVLKSVGFTDMAVFWTVLIEAAVLCVISAVIGLGIAALVFPTIFLQVGLPIGMSLPPVVWVIGVAMAVLLAALIAFIPARRATRLTIAEAIAAR
jgi:putative ABC transport system permease protein